MKVLMFAFFLSFGFFIHAQEISVDGVAYEIKKDRIFKGDVDVTETLTLEEKQQIMAAFDKKKREIEQAEDAEKRLDKAKKEQEKREKQQEKAEKETEKAEKAQKKAEKKQKQAEKEQDKLEKEQKKIEKEQKQAEKELKQSEKAQSNLDKSIEKHEDALKKYKKLKRKGKLSPLDEEKWLEKIAKYKAASEKAKRKLK